MKSNTESSPPNRICWQVLKFEPKREKFRNEIEEDSVTKSRTEQLPRGFFWRSCFCGASPNLTPERMLMEDPSTTKSRTEHLPSNICEALMEIPEPYRQKLRSETEEAMLT
jgi:hypothetical protein